MSKYRKVTLGMWADEKFRQLSKPQPNGQSLWQWLITGPRTTQIPGVVLGTPEELAASIRWPLEGFLKAFGEVSSKGMAKGDSEAGLVWLPKAVEHNRPESPNVVRSWRMAWDDVPECALKLQVWGDLRHFTEGMGEGFAKAFTEACAKPSPNQEQEQEQEQEKSMCQAAPDVPLLRLVEPGQAKKPDLARQQATSWVEWFNRKFQRQFRVTDEVVRMVKALNARGYHERPDMRGVALFLRDEWQDDPKMAKFLKPDSILVASKFGIRLDEAKERYPEIWAERVDGEEGGNAA